MQMSSHNLFFGSRIGIEECLLCEFLLLDGDIVIVFDIGRH